MINKYFFLLVCFCTFSLSAQQIFFKMGKNNTAYDFKGADASDVNYRNTNGDTYEVGYEYNFTYSQLSYIGGISLNQFNANASRGATSYTWQTSYLGIQNLISYNLSDYRNAIAISIQTGVNAATIVKGEQFIDTRFFDLKKQDEFSGIILQPIIGINGVYKVSNNLLVSVGYNFSKSFNISNSTSEKVSFITNQLQFGIYIPLN